MNPDFYGVSQNVGFHRGFGDIVVVCDLFVGFALRHTLKHQQLPSSKRVQHLWRHWIVFMAVAAVVIATLFAGANDIRG